MSDWTWTQDSRIGQIETALGEDKVLLESFSAVEHFNEPFLISVLVLSEDLAIDFTPYLGTGVSIRINGDEGFSRFFHGLLFEAGLESIEGGSARYWLQLRPWLSLLDGGRNSRIFQGKSVRDIVEAVIQGAGFTDYSISLDSLGMTPRNYCTQFRESDFNFIARLLEEEGILYYFQHAEGSHTLMISDNAANGPDLGAAVEVYQGEAEDFRRAHLSTWGPHVRRRVNKVTLRDTHFRRATEILNGADQAAQDFTNDDAEFYDYPGGWAYFADDGSADGAPVAEARLLAARAIRKVYFGDGNVFAIATGAQMTVNEAAGANPYIVVGASHTFSGQSYIGADSAEPSLQVHVTALPADTTWRPDRKTPKPVAGGPQTATVVGAAGEVIEVDTWGRVHVQFPWDRQGTFDSNSSCWIRVSQGWADGGFGLMHIPRIGEEVLVDFLDGDLDRPVVTGRLYNSARMPPYPLPAEKTKSTWKSQTVGETGPYDGAENPPSGTGFNEIRFEDKGGSEEVFVYAQRDFTGWFRLDESRKTGRDTSVRVGRNRETAVKENETLTVEQGDETRTLQQGSRTTTIEKADTATLNTGDYSLTVSQGQATVEAAQKITLKVGSNQIVISPQGVEITGLTVKASAETSLQMQGLTSDFQAETMLTISGMTVQIN